MDDALARLRGTIDSLLDVTQLETGRMRFVFAPYDFVAVARRVIESRRAAFTRKNLRLETDLPTLPLHATGDADRVARAIAHLLDNAQKFTPAGGTVAVEVRSSATHCARSISALAAGSWPPSRSPSRWPLRKPSTVRAKVRASMGLARKPSHPTASEVLRSPSAVMATRGVVGMRPRYIVG